MITDRTQSDINTAKNLIETKVKKFVTLTAAEIEALERGTMTINTLNRIEEKQSELKTLLNQCGYYGTDITVKTNWKIGDMFYDVDFQRIIDNENLLRNALYTFIDTPNTPDISFGYEDINNLEKILVDIENMITIMKKNFRKSGTFKSGEVLLW
nr:MAG TPA: hypothetical protein [Bacteriophage sp.]